MHTSQFMKREITYHSQSEILDKAYLSCADLLQLVPIGKKEAYQLIKEIRDEMSGKGIQLFNQRVKLVPTQYVVDKLNLDVNYIRKQARKGSK